MPNQKRRATFLLAVVAAAALMLSGCSKQSPESKETPVTLDAIREEVAAAFDGTASSAHRRLAADEAMRLLLDLLNQPESVGISDEEWASSPRPGVEEMVRHHDLGGGVHLYALSLPGKSLVEERERIAVQVRRSAGSPAASELALLEDSRLEAARLYGEGARPEMTLIMRTGEGAGYLAHFAGGSGGTFQPVADAFAGLAGQYGSLTLQVDGGFLLVTDAYANWTPFFDEMQPNRLHLAAEVYIDRNERFELVDESRFDAFRLMAIAHDPALCKSEGDCPGSVLEVARQTPKAAAQAAWELAAAKLARLMQEERTWSEEMVELLPAGSRSIRGEGRDVQVRLLTVPAPEGVEDRAMTIAQFRTGGGVPMARVLDLPGPVDDFRVMAYGGVPSLFLVVDQTPDPESEAVTKGLHLLRLDAGHDWRPVEAWVGYVPEIPYWNLAGVTPNGLSVSWEKSKVPEMSLQLEDGPEPRLGICRFPTSCHYLTWIDGKVHALNILAAQLTEAKQALAPEELIWRANLLAKFLAQIDPGSIAAARLQQLLDPNGALGVQVLDAGDTTRLVTMPPNPTGVQNAVIHAPGQGLVVTAYDGFVTNWLDVRIVQGGSERRLLVLGRSPKGAAVFAFTASGSGWLPVDALETQENRILMESFRVMHTPGATQPVRGILALGDTRLTAELTDAGALFCENGIACLQYGYSNGWQLH